MKKITSFLMMFMLFVGMGWAQGPLIPEKSENGTIKWYTIKGLRGDHDYLSANVNNNPMTCYHKAALDLSSLWYFTASGDGVIMHNGAGKQLMHNLQYGDQGEVWYLIDHTFSDAGLAISKGTNTSGNCIDYQGGANVGWWTPGATDFEGTTWIFEAVTPDVLATLYNKSRDAKVAKLEGIKNLTALYGNVQQVIDEIKALDVTKDADFTLLENKFKAVYAKAEGKGLIFTNQATDSRGGRIIGVGVDNNKKIAVAVEREVNIDPQIWVIKHNPDGSFKLCNWWNNLYLGQPNLPLELKPASDAPLYTFLTKDKENQMPENVTTLVVGDAMAHCGDSGRGFKLMNYNSTSDKASLWKVEPTVNPIDATQDAYTLGVNTNNEYNTFLCSKARAWQEAFGLVKDAQKFKSNAKEASEGSYQGLLDGKDGAAGDGADDDCYFHSAYNNDPTVAGEAHNLRVDLTENPVQSFYFYMKQRNGNNRPVEVEILVSDNDKDYKSAKTLRTTMSNAEQYFSQKITLDKAYQYIRFDVKKTNTNTKFFTLSEFYILPVNEITTAACAARDAYCALQLDTPNFDAQIELFVNGYNQVVADDHKPGYLETLNSFTNVQDKPEYGNYPTEAKIKAIDAINNATSLTEIEKAMATFYASLNEPLFMIQAAGNEDYCRNAAAYMDGTTSKWANPSSKFDKEFWFRAASSTSEAITLGSSYNFVSYTNGKTLYGNQNLKVEQNPTHKDAVILRNGEGKPEDHVFLHCEGTHKIVLWGAYAEASAWKVVFLGSSYDLSKVSNEVLAKAKELEAVVATYTAVLGTGLNQAAETENMKKALNDAAVLFAKPWSEWTVQELTNTKNAIIGAYSLNMPVENKFYRMRCADGNKYIMSTASGNCVMENAQAKNTAIFYFDNSKGMLAYVDGRYLGDKMLKAVGETSSVRFQAAKNGRLGEYNIAVGERYQFGKNANLDSGDGNFGNEIGYNWWLEAVNELPVTFKGNAESGYYATINAPVALTIPQGVTAYTGKKGTDVVNLTAITTGVIPANSPVLLKAAEEGVKNFPIAYDNHDEKLVNNEFVGTIATEARNGKGFLGLGFGATDTKIVGFYNVNAENLKGFRARLNNDNAAVNGLRLSFEDVTGIEGVVEELNGNAEIFDLSGRRVVAPAKGIYIVNGKKVYVK